MQKKIFLFVSISLFYSNCLMATATISPIKHCHLLAQSLSALSDAQSDATCRSELLSAGIAADNAGKDLANNEYRNALFSLRYSIKALNYSLALDCEKKDELKLQKEDLVGLMFELGR